MDSLTVLVVCFFAPIVFYIVARVISAAYFRSKRDFLRSLLNGDEKK